MDKEYYIYREIKDKCFETLHTNQAAYEKACKANEAVYKANEEAYKIHLKTK